MRRMIVIAALRTGPAAACEPLVAGQAVTLNGPDVRGGAAIPRTRLGCAPCRIPSKASHGALLILYVGIRTTHATGRPAPKHAAAGHRDATMRPARAAAGVVAPEGGRGQLDGVMNIARACRRIRAALAADEAARHGPGATGPRREGIGMGLQVFDRIISDRGSRYAVSGGAARSRAEAAALLAELRRGKRFARATHNSWAAILGDEPVRDDDGEAGAGAQILQMLDRAGLRDHMVIVTRWYGGRPLGGDRFRHVAAAVRHYLRETGLGDRGAG